MRLVLLLTVLSSSVLLLACPGPKCSAATCPTGCCDASGACQAGSQPLACGIAGGSCSTCLLGQQCLQGVCFSGTGTGGGSGGGGGSTGGGGGSSAGIRLIPASATVPFDSSVELSAELTGSAPDQQVNWSLVSGGGRLIPTSPSTATYSAFSSAATVRIRAQANYLSSIATFADFTVSSTARAFQVFPEAISRDPYVIALGSRHTFAAARQQPSQTPNIVGVRGVEWTVWPSGSVTDGTLTSTASMQRLYAREISSNVWASTSVSGDNTSEASVEISPSLATVAPNGVVQFTANIFNGQGAEWTTAPGSGSINFTTGTYTAPATPGVYAVACQPAGGIGTRFGVATIIVQ